MLTEYWDVRAPHLPAGRRDVSEILAYFEGTGEFDVKLRDACSMEELKGLIDEGIPVMVRTFSSRRRRYGHYQVVVGYGPEGIYCNDPASPFSIRARSDELFRFLWDMQSHPAKRGCNAAILVLPSQRR